MRTTQIPLGTPINKSNPLAQGLVGFWPLNEGGGKLAFDSTTLNNPGSFSGTSIVSKISQKGQCVSFASGGSDFINCGNKSPVNVSTYFTIGWWFNRAANSLCHVSKYSGTTTEKAYLLQIFSDNNVYFVVNTSGGLDPYVTCAMPSATNGLWTFIAAVFNPNLTGMTNIGKIYINGVLQTMTSSGAYPTTINQSSQSFRINVYNASTYGTCSMQNVFLYNRPLTGTEVMQLYKNSYQMFQSPKQKIAI